MAIYTPHETWSPSEQCEIVGVTSYGWARVVIVIAEANGVRRTRRREQHPPTALRATGGLPEIKAAMAAAQAEQKRRADIRKTGRLPWHASQDADRP